MLCLSALATLLSLRAAAEADPKPAFRIPGGWYFKPAAMRSAAAPGVYDRECPPRNSLMLQGDRNEATLTMKLDHTPGAPSFLAVEGQIGDQPGASQMSVTVNGETVFSGPARFPEKAWSRMGINIPAGVLKQGENTIVIANTAPDAGWIAVSEAYWIDPNTCFLHFLDGSNNTPWVFHDGNSRQTGVHGDGRAELPGGQVAPNYLGASHQSPKIAITPGARVKLTATASGSGTLRLAVWCYRPYRDGTFTPDGFCGGNTKLLPQRSLPSPAFKLSDTPKTFSCVLTPFAGTGLILPRMYCGKDSKATVTEFKLELLPPEEK
jgi:hypothetical protein